MRFSKPALWSILLSIIALTTPFASAQISLSTAVDLALRNNPKVKMAQADLDKARASLSEARDTYIPSVTTNGGYGGSTGVPLSLPVVFSISAQSLVFNFSQKDYVRAAGAGVSAATFALNEARNEVAEDTVTTYISLNNAQQRKAALAQSSDFSARLVQIVDDRFATGLDPHIEITKARRTNVQMQLQRLLVDDEIAYLAEHLARITGATGPRTETIASSIPAFLPPTEATGSIADTDGMRAALANATAKNYTAHGDARYRLRPQFAFSAGYSRISTIGSSYGDYYPRFANNAFSHNSFEVGVQISVPLLDYVRQAKARESAADSRHSAFEAASQRLTFLDGRLKLQHAASELAARAELASLDRDFAQDQLETIQLQLKAVSTSTDGPQLTPKDEQNARIQERQRFVEYLSAELQLRQTQVSLMRQNGQLGPWLKNTIAGASIPPTHP